MLPCNGERVNCPTLPPPAYGRAAVNTTIGSTKGNAMVSRRKRLAFLGAVGGVVTLGAAVLAGTALAQTPTPGSGTGSTSTAQQQHQAQQDQFLNDLAKNLSIDRSKLDTALKTTETQEVDAAVTAGKLTATQGTQMKQAIANGTAPIGFGFGGPGGPGGPGMHLPPNAQQAAQAALSAALGGETQAQLQADRQAGKTPDQIAQAHGTTVAAVNTAIANAVKPLLDQAVTAGTMTATQETQILDGIKNAKGFALGGHGGPGGPGGPPPAGAPGASPSTTSSPTA